MKKKEKKKTERNKQKCRKMKKIKKNERNVKNEKLKNGKNEKHDIPVVQQISVEIPQVQFLVFWEVADMPVCATTGTQLLAEFPHFLRECGLRS